jgi:hypothetical protein
MIDALKPAFTLFQFKDDGRIENLVGQAVINRKSFEETDFAYNSKKSGRRKQLSLCPSVPLSPYFHWSYKFR